MNEFIAFARAHGLILDYAEPDGRWRRCKTVDKPRRRNGCYILDVRGGAVKNYATMTDFATWRDGSAARVPPEQYREMRRKAAEMMRKARALEAQKHAQAAQEAERIVKAATLLTPAPGVPWKPWRPGKDPVLAHPYLVRKGLPNASCLVYEDKIVVPMRIERQHRRELVSVQTIAADGTKLFLPGGRTKGAVYHMGPASAREVWLVEGFATGWSLLMALKGMYRDASVVVCFSAGNLKHAGATHVFADNDASGAGQKAAEATGLPWVMPEAVGMDANDVHAQQGLRALQQLIRGGT
jgi:putative DNA primase/helicase